MFEWLISLPLPLAIAVGIILGVVGLAIAYIGGYLVVIVLALTFVFFVHLSDKISLRLESNKRRKKNTARLRNMKRAPTGPSGGSDQSVRPNMVRNPSSVNLDWTDRDEEIFQHQQKLLNMPPTNEVMRRRMGSV